MNIIETQGLTRRFGRTEAVHDLTMSLPAGGVLALLGANGAGKTTTLKLLMNLLRPDSGQARVLGVAAAKLGEREFAQIGYVSENQELPRWMTVRQLLDYLRPFYPTWDRELERRLSEQFALPPEARLGTLSRGMQMKAALLSSLVYRPRLLVLDEPFSGLDPLVRDELIHGLLEVTGVGECSVLISSHDIAEIERLAERVAMLDRGRLALSESVEALQARFRRIEITSDEKCDLATTAMPGGWLETERSGRVLRFIDSNYDPVATEQKCRERFPSAQVVARPMTLREIFIVLARQQRTARQAA